MIKQAFPSIYVYKLRNKIQKIIATIRMFNECSLLRGKLLMLLSIQTKYGPVLWYEISSCFEALYRT